ncbi:MAG TPA: hypothetical protein DCX53_14250 [Anaerolineae bacterium]|nr:hypothetical protein [Anaerolineae bacterium]
MKLKIYPISILFALLVSACAPQAAPTLIPTEEPSPVITKTIVPEQTASASKMWRAIRDPRHGFGFAIPCWWLTNSIFEDDGLYTIKNYDDAYFQANSTKGFWDWPNGTLKLDIIIMEGIDPAKSDADAYMQFVDPTMTGLVSAEQQQIGSHTATVLTLSNLVNTADPDTKVYIFRFHPDKLLVVVPFPQSIIGTPDFEAFLASTALSQDEQIKLPDITPAPALIDASCAQ